MTDRLCIKLAHSTWATEKELNSKSSYASRIREKQNKCEIIKYLNFMVELQTQRNRQREKKQEEQQCSFFVDRQQRSAFFSFLFTEHSKEIEI